MDLSETICCIDQSNDEAEEKTISQHTPNHTPTVTYIKEHQVSSGDDWVVPQACIKDDATVQSGVYAVGEQDEEDDGSSSSDEDSPTRADAILDGGAADNMFNVPPECFDTYKKCNASWNTAKRSVRVQAKGQGRISVRAVSADNKAYNLMVDAFHVPELASNLMSVHYLCNRGYQVVHALPVAEIRVKENIVFNCPVRGKLWYLPLTLNVQPHHSYVFAAPGVPDCLRELHERPHNLWPS